MRITSLERPVSVVVGIESYRQQGGSGGAQPRAVRRIVRRNSHVLAEGWRGESREENQGRQQCPKDRVHRRTPFQCPRLPPVWHRVLGVLWGGSLWNAYEQTGAYLRIDIF